MSERWVLFGFADDETADAWLDAARENGLLTMSRKGMFAGSVLDAAAARRMLDDHGAKRELADAPSMQELLDRKSTQGVRAE